MRRTTTAEVRPNAGRATRLSSQRGKLAVLTACRARATRFAVAQDARRDEHRLTTTRNPGNVALERIDPVQSALAVKDEPRRSQWRATRLFLDTVPAPI
jgi:hypothetical protein